MTSEKCQDVANHYTMVILHFYLSKKSELQKNKSLEDSGVSEHFLYHR